MIKEVNGQTRLCGLIGCPVQHTLSPVIHNYLAEVTGRNLVYVPFQVEQDLEYAVRGGFALNVLGMNVTVPYKADVMNYLAELDENAMRIGAVNTLVRTEAGYKGYNTDYLGLKRTMEEEGISAAGRDVVILGAGGAANTAAYLCAQAGVRSLYILNRTFEKAERLAGHISRHFPETPVVPMRLEDYAKLPDERFLAVQTTSWGLYPHVENAPLTDPAFYKKIDQAVEVIYNPEETRFMKLVREQGGQACDGLKMLLYQAVAAYELWNGLSIEEAVCRRVLERLAEQFRV